MSQHILSSAGCWFTRGHSSYAAQFLHQYRRTLMTISATSTQSACSKTVRPIPTFLLPLSNPSPSRQRQPRCPSVFMPRIRASQQARFSSTPLRRATSVTLNPRVDENGNPMTIKISPRAAKRLREITSPSSSEPSLSKESYDHLRVSVTSGGCHGFQYIMSLDPSSKIDPEEDTVFEADLEGADEQATNGGTAKVVMDSASLEILRDSTIDYTVELIGSQFKVVDNPRATSNCGCGTSFDVQL
ncbi:hypothetical protein VTO42DRAFT_4231 [Malbranchea cinnamomea]